MKVQHNNHDDDLKRATIRSCRVHACGRVAGEYSAHPWRLTRLRVSDVAHGTEKGGACLLFVAAVVADVVGHWRL